MSEGIKLPRLPKPDGRKYTTGDAQNWTYEYTWEDWEAAINAKVSTKPPPNADCLFAYLAMEFSKRPEDLAYFYRPYQRINLDPETIRRHLNKLMTDSAMIRSVKFWADNIEQFNR